MRRHHLSLLWGLSLLRKKLSLQSCDFRAEVVPVVRDIPEPGTSAGFKSLFSFS